MDTRTSPIRLRLEQVRAALQRHALEAVLVPSSDPHLSEYLPARWQAREWLSGFTGSMSQPKPKRRKKSASVIIGSVSRW